MAGSIAGTLYAGAFKNTGLVSRSKRCTISNLTTGDVIPLIPVLKGESCVGFVVKLVSKPNKVVAAAEFGPDNDPNGMATDVGTGLGSDGTVGTEFFGNGALMTPAAVENADNTIDGTFTVMVGPCITDLVFDVQAMFVTNSIA
jgi:hypothetical protein